MIAIGYLDGRRLSRAVVAGARFVADRAEPLNRINVFPVPDGDTGTNIASTLQKIAAGIARIRQRHARELSRVLADEAVGGARGNSGAVLLRLRGGTARPSARLHRRLRGRGRAGGPVGLWRHRAARRGDHPDGHPRLGAVRCRARFRDPRLRRAPARVA